MSSFVCCFLALFLVSFRCQQVILNNGAFLNCVQVSASYPLNVGGGFNKISCPSSYQYALVQFAGSGLSDTMIYSDANGNQGSVGVPCGNANFYYANVQMPSNDIYRGQYLPCATSFTITFPVTQHCTNSNPGRNPSMSFIAFCNTTN